MKTLIILFVATIALRLTYELIKGIQNRKTSRQYPGLNMGDKVIYREVDESGIRKTPAEVVWQNGPLVMIKTSDGYRIVVDRTDLKIDEK